MCFRWKVIMLVFLMIVISAGIAVVATLPMMGPNYNTSLSQEPTVEDPGQNVTCEDYNNPDLVRICHEQPTMQMDCVIWNCSICFWGNDSCYNFDVGPRTDCPTPICVLEPKPSPIGPKSSVFLYPILAILCSILLGVLLYLAKLVRENRAYRRSRENQVRRFLDAGESFREARRGNEESERILQELAAAANIPLPVADPPRPLNELERLANEPIEADSDEPPQSPQQNVPASASSGPSGPPPPRRFGRLRQTGHTFANNIQTRYQPFRQRMQTRFHLARQAIRSNPFSRLRNAE